MHACGHDGHVAMGAVAARLLARRAPPGRARVLFQPAEEGEGGAQAVVRDGALEGVDVVLGVHLWNELPVGTLGVKAGPLMAAVDRLRIVVRGRGGHGGKPHRAPTRWWRRRTWSPPCRPSSPARSRRWAGGADDRLDPRRPGLQRDPGRGDALGTIRTFDEALRRSMPERVPRIARGVAAALQMPGRGRGRPGNPAVVNDARGGRDRARAAVRVVGEAKVVEPEPTMGGEDMAVYFERVPGCFVFVGSANPARGLDQPHHSPRFDFDEDALAVGCEFLVQAAEEALRVLKL